MKRLLFAALLVVLVSSFAWAQDGQISLSFADTPVYQIVNAIAAGQGYKLKPADNLPGEKVSINIADQTMAQALTQLLNPRGFGFLINSTDHVIVVYKQEGVPNVASSIATPSQQPRTAIQGAPWDLSVAGSSYAAGVRGFDARAYAREAMVAGTYLEDRAYLEQRRFSGSDLAYSPASYGSSGFGRVYGGYYGGSYGYVDPVYGARFRGAATTGYMKINANKDTHFAKYLHVLRKEGNNWVYVGGGGKSFRSFHDPMELPVGHQTLRFELRRDGKTRYLTEEFDIMSKFDRQHALQYTVDEDMFNSFADTEEIKREQ